MLKARDTAFVSLPDGSERLIRTGDIVADDDPVAEGRSGLFEPFEFAPHEPVITRHAQPPASEDGDPQDTPDGDSEPPATNPAEPADIEAKPGTRRARAVKEN